MSRQPLLFNLAPYGEVRVFHYGDWSGDALISWEQDDHRHKVELPATALISNPAEWLTGAQLKGRQLTCPNDPWYDLPLDIYVTAVMVCCKARTYSRISSAVEQAISDQIRRDEREEVGQK